MAVNPANISQVRYDQPQPNPWAQLATGIGQGAANFATGYTDTQLKQDLAKKKSQANIIHALAQAGKIEPIDMNDLSKGFKAAKPQLSYAELENQQDVIRKTWENQNRQEIMRKEAANQAYQRHLQTSPWDTEGALLASQSTYRDFPLMQNAPIITDENVGTGKDVYDKKKWPWSDFFKPKEKKPKSSLTPTPTPKKTEKIGKEKETKYKPGDVAVKMIGGRKVRYIRQANGTWLPEGINQ